MRVLAILEFLGWGLGLWFQGSRVDKFLTAMRGVKELCFQQHEP